MSSFAPIYLAGPTASGKTAVSIELAKRLSPAEIINADAFQVYQGMETLVATPSMEERQDIPHHLFSIFPVSKECDVASFAELARAKIEEVSQRAVPILVGGSGLYLKSITHGIGPTPPGDPELRKKLEAFTLEELVEQYAELDPQGAATTNLKNRRYVNRNLEICLLTGRAASELKSEWEQNAPDFFGVYLTRPRELTYDRINRRTLQMFDEGVVKQVDSLPEEPSITASKAIGLREINELLESKLSQEQCVAAIQQATRRYAKRQETWFRKEPQYHSVKYGESDSPATIVDKIEVLLGA